MKGRRVAGLSGLFAAAAIVALVAPGAVLGAAAAPSSTGVTSMNVRVCATPALGSAACDAIRHFGPTNKPNGHGHGGGGGGGGGGGTTTTPVSYTATQLQSAYGMTAAASSDGAGNTVAIVDAYDDPNAYSDLATYRNADGLVGITQCNVSGQTLSDPSSTTPCFAKVNESGTQSSYPTGNTGWAQEISVDVDAVSAMCPKCNILLVEANSANLSDLGSAVNTAAGFGPVAIGNSYGAGEYSTEGAAAAQYYDHSGIAVTAATGDSGYGVEFPAAAQSVVAVGGTSLQQTSQGWSQTVWSGTGSGCSAYIAKPAWQSDTGCANRTVGDVAADADPNTGMDVYDTDGEPGWMVFGGTSVATQLMAGVYGLAGGPPSGSTGASSLYGVTSGLYDVQSGSNGSCTGHGRFVNTSLAYLCTGVPGYDGPTGMGTPNGALSMF